MLFPVQPRAAGVFLSLVCLMGLVACGSSSSSAPAGCNTDPWECPSGQNCWPQTDTSYACLYAGPGTLGSACLDVVGTASCAAGLGCAQMASGNMGTCVAYCDAQHPCPSGTTCTVAHLTTCDASSSSCAAISECLP